MINTLDRNPALGKVRWENVLKSDQYWLPVLKKKAPDQWLYENLERKPWRNKYKLREIKEKMAAGPVSRIVQVMLQSTY